MNYDILIKNLESFGLSENEARIYCSVLALEEATVDRITRHAELNRTSSYPILERLKQLGLLAQGKKKKKTVYKAVRPERLFEILDEKKEYVAAILPDLKSLFDISRGRPDVSFFEGREGLKTVLNNILSEAKEICILGDGENFLNVIPGWTDAYVKKRAGKNIKVKIILRGTPNAIKSIKRHLETDKEINKSLQMRVLPELYKINFGGFDLYNNKVILYSFEKQNHAVVIESHIISQLMRSVFYVLWEFSEKFNYLLK
jgi:sugar-specific transcriptional regulator TrmB